MVAPNSADWVPLPPGNCAEAERGRCEEWLERLFFASILKPLDGGVDEIHRVFAHCSDYTPERTDYHINSLTLPPSYCATAQTWAVCPYEGMCPAMEKRGKQSPVAFAYARGEKRPMKGVEYRQDKTEEELKDREEAILKEFGIAAGKGDDNV